MDLILWVVLGGQLLCFGRGPASFHCMSMAVMDSFSRNRDGEEGGENESDTMGMESTLKLATIGIKLSCLLHQNPNLPVIDSIYSYKIHPIPNPLP